MKKNIVVLSFGLAMILFTWTPWLETPVWVRDVSVAFMMIMAMILLIWGNKKPNRAPDGWLVRVVQLGVLVSCSCYLLFQRL